MKVLLNLEGIYCGAAPLIYTTEVQPHAALFGSSSLAKVHGARSVVASATVQSHPGRAEGVSKACLDVLSSAGLREGDAHRREGLAAIVQNIHRGLRYSLVLS